VQVIDKDNVPLFLDVMEFCDKGEISEMLKSQVRSMVILGGGLFTGWITCLAIIVQNLLAI